MERLFAPSRLFSFCLSAHRLVLCFLVRHSPATRGGEEGEKFVSATGFCHLVEHENFMFISCIRVFGRFA